MDHVIVWGIVWTIVFAALTVLAIAERLYAKWKHVCPQCLHPDNAHQLTANPHLQTCTRCDCERIVK